MCPMTTENDLRCQERRSIIQPGRLCLSESAEENPPGVGHSDFKSYCIG